MPSGDVKGQLLGRAGGCGGGHSPPLFALPLLGARLCIFGVFPISVPVCITLLSLLVLFLPFPFGALALLHSASAHLRGGGAQGHVPRGSLQDPPRSVLIPLLEATQLPLLGAGPPGPPLTHFTLRRTAALHGAVGSRVAFGARDVTSPFVQIQTFLTFCAKVSAEAGLTVLDFAFDALVHVCIAKAKVSQWTGWEADPNLPDIVPLQKDEELGGTSQAPVELRAQVAAPGTALAQLSANSPLPLALHHFAAAC